MKPLVVVAGCTRTGTSLMMKCLRKSGFELGNLGGTFVCENKEFNAVTRRILKNKQEGLKHRREFIEFLKNSDIEALKANAITLQYWMGYKIFDEAKYIRTLRYGPSVINSLVSRGKAKTKDEAEAMYNNYTRALRFLDNKKNITVWFEDMFIRPEETSKRIASFLDIEEFSFEPLKPHLWHFGFDEIN